MDNKAAAYDGIAQEISRLKREIGVLHELVSHHQSQAQSTQSEIQMVQKRIEMLRDVSDNHVRSRSKCDGIVVTDHAVIRYLERVVGVDIGAVKRKISGGAVVKCAAAIGDGRYPIEPGVKAVVRGGKVVTIIKYDEE
ncbi:hypothetical protein [Hydrogenimonas sp.]